MKNIFSVTVNLSNGESLIVNAKEGFDNPYEIIIVYNDDIIDKFGSESLYALSAIDNEKSFKFNSSCWSLYEPNRAIIYDFINESKHDKEKLSSAIRAAVDKIKQIKTLLEL